MLGSDYVHASDFIGGFVVASIYYVSGWLSESWID